MFRLWQTAIPYLFRAFRLVRFFARPRLFRGKRPTPLLFRLVPCVRPALFAHRRPLPVMSPEDSIGYPSHLVGNTPGKLHDWCGCVLGLGNLRPDDTRANPLETGDHETDSSSLAAQHLCANSESLRALGSIPSHKRYPQFESVLACERKYRHEHTFRRILARPSQD